MFCIWICLYVLNLLASAPRAAPESRFLHSEQKTADLAQRRYWSCHVLEPNPPFVRPLLTGGVSSTWCCTYLAHSYTPVRPHLSLCSSCSRFVLYIWLFEVFSCFMYNKHTFKVKVCKCFKCFCWFWRHQQAPVCWCLLMWRQLIKVSSWRLRPGRYNKSCLFVCSATTWWSSQHDLTWNARREMDWTVFKCSMAFNRISFAHFFWCIFEIMFVTEFQPDLSPFCW